MAPSPPPKIRDVLGNAAIRHETPSHMRWKKRQVRPEGSSQQVPPRPHQPTFGQKEPVYPDPKGSHNRVAVRGIFLRRCPVAFPTFPSIRVKRRAPFTVSKEVPHSRLRLVELAAWRALSHKMKAPRVKASLLLPLSEGRRFK